MPDERSPNDNNPLLDDPPPLFRANLVILRDAADLLEDTLEDWGSGGTYVQAMAHGKVPKGETTATPTFAVLRVDTPEPVHPDGNPPGSSVPFPDSWLDFPRQGVPVLKPQPVAQDGLKTDHIPIVVASKSFLPGQKYWGLLLVYTEDGRWRVKKHQFTMQQRVVEIIFRQISINNDGATGEGKAYFHWWVVDRDTVVKGYATPTIPISDRPSPGEEWKEHIGLSTYVPENETPLRLGPYSVSEDKFNRCLILTRAIGKHTTGIDDKSGNVKVELTVGTAPPEEEIVGDAGLEFPIGPNDERFEGHRFFMEAANVNDDDDDNEFSYTLRGLYSVDYQ